MARPIPLLPPVTMATLPFKLILVISLEGSCNKLRYLPFKDVWPSRLQDSQSDFPTRNKVENKRDYCEDENDVNQRASDVKREPGSPQKDENDSNDGEHMRIGF